MKSEGCDHVYRLEKLVELYQCIKCGCYHHKNCERSDKRVSNNCIGKKSRKFDKK
jgi:hypothetical protein